MPGIDNKITVRAPAELFVVAQIGKVLSEPESQAILRKSGQPYPKIQDGKLILEIMLKRPDTTNEEETTFYVNSVYEFTNRLFEAGCELIETDVAPFPVQAA